jgi:hypothetical protein
VYNYKTRLKLLSIHHTLAWAKNILQAHPRLSLMLFSYEVDNLHDWVSLLHKNRNTILLLNPTLFPLSLLLLFLCLAFMGLHTTSASTIPGYIIQATGWLGLASRASPPVVLDHFQRKHPLKTLPENASMLASLAPGPLTFLFLEFCPTRLSILCLLTR